MMIITATILHLGAILSTECLKIGEIFPENNEYMIAIQDYAIITYNYKKCVMKNPSITNESSRKF